MIKKRLAAAKEELKEMGITDVRMMARAGDPLGEVMAVAQRFAVVVAADSGKSRLKRFLIGSVAFNIMGSSPVSVMNVR